MLTPVRRGSLARRSGWAALLGFLYLLYTGCNRPAPVPDPPVVAPEPDVTPGPCRLAVLVVFDQMRADYLERWRVLWGEGGFRRLQADGAWFTNCHYPFACTETGPGHAALATGRSPSSNGIIGNYWYDRQAKGDVYCVGSVRPYETVPAGAAGDGPSTPERLLGATVGDVLREAPGGKARVISLSFKDRAAVLLAGRRPNACYWFDFWTGWFMTSTYYRDQPHRWVAEFNRGRFADQWFGKEWDRLRPDLDYLRYSGRDDAPGEATGWMQGRTFPHPMTGRLGRLESKPYANKDYYGAVLTSPFGNELLLELAKKAIDAEGLGSGATRDLLCLSFSATDPIGHSWGPDSQEMLDAMLRADRLVADLLTYLDARVGPGRYLLVLTSDHGVCPLPEVARARGLDAGRVSPEQLTEDANSILQQAYPSDGEKCRWVEANVETWLYLNHRLLAQRGLKAADVEATLAEGLKKRPGVLAAYTRAQLAGSGPTSDPIRQAVLKPYYIPAGGLEGTGHGSPHPYDTHVPLLIYGPHVRPGQRAEAVSPQAVAGILATALGVAPPADIEASVPDVFQSKP
jgi:hypothetical protein